MTASYGNLRLITPFGEHPRGVRSARALGRVFLEMIDTSAVVFWVDTVPEISL
jgi:hypothetical protein